ncbi:MAG: dethiobiotin synthase [Pirellulales bacterium]
MNDADHANTAAAGGNRAQSIFVIGTDTEIGKTYVSSLLVKRLSDQGKRVGVYKPVASGFTCDVPEDAQRLIRASGIDWPWQRVCPQAFSAAALAPPLAAEREGRGG